MVGRPRLTRRQFQLLCGVQKHPQFKRLVLQRSRPLQVGLRVGVEGLLGRLEEHLGSGVLGQVYGLRTSEQRYAWKRPRADFASILESFRCEAEVIDLLSERSDSSLRPARLFRQGPQGLLKELCEGATLWDLFQRGQISSAMISAFEAALALAGRLEQEFGLVLDLSPKNCCWQQGWVLLDGGPKLLPSPLQACYRSPNWSGYQALIEKKYAGSGPLSSPSSLQRPLESPTGPWPERWVFVREWWCWLPLEAGVACEGLYFDVVAEGCDNEYLWEWSPGGLAVNPSYAECLAQQPLLMDCAARAWQQQFGRAFPGDFDRQLPSAPPISPGQLSDLVSEGSYAQALPPPEPAPPVPRLQVRLYDHWSDFKNPESRLQPLDIFCQEPLLEAACPWPAEVFQAQVPASPDGRFAQLHCRTVGRWPRAWLLLPGFRAPAISALPLSQGLIEQGWEGLFVHAYLGVRNAQGQALISGGPWETALIFQTLDYLRDYFGVQACTVVACSYATLGAGLAAQLHPLVDHLVLDSAPRQPFALLRYLAELRGIGAEVLLEQLQAAGLPQPYQAQPPQRAGLRVHYLRPFRDRFLDLCGHLGGEQGLRYQGRHAALMRHDVFRKGIPEECWKYLLQALSRNEERQYVVV